LPDDIFDVFLSHNSKDKPAVRQIAETLRARGLRVWLDEWELPPGRRWQDELEKIIRTVRSSAVLIGKDGLGPWEIPEMRACLSQMVKRDLPVIPVLLPGAPDAPEFPLFLAENTWVDLRSGISEDGLSRLHWGITGEKPDPTKARPHATAPRLHNLPFSPLGDLLKGRDEELQRLQEGRTTAITQAQTIHGLGGIGKTRLAVERAWRSGSQYDTAFFVVAESPEALQSNLANLARPELLNLPESKAPAQEETVAAVIRWLREHDRWLLILDNVDTQEAKEAVLKVLPSLSTGRVLITSRLREWPPSVQRQPLETLSLDEAQKFLLERTASDRTRSEDDLAQARRLAEELGGLPLALEQAAAYIVHHQMSLSEYLNDWQSEREQVLNWYDGSVMQYPAPVAVTWQKTFQQLSPTAAAILRLTAYLAPDPIPDAMVENGKRIVKSALRLLRKEKKSEIRVVNFFFRPKVGNLPIKEAITELATYSMVTRKGKSFTVHRVVQDALRSRVPVKNRRDWIELSLQGVNDFSPAEPDDVGTWPIWDLLRPHATLVVQYADDAGIAHPTGPLMSQLALLFLSKSLYRDAEPLMRRALQIDEDSFGPDHPKVAGRLNNLAQLLHTTNRLLEAEPLMRRALQIDEDFFGPHHPTLAVRLGNLASLLQDTNRLADAEPLEYRALQIEEDFLGPHHPSVAIRLNNLASLFQATNRLLDAEPLMRRALQIDEDSLGPHHPKVAIRLNNLASLLQATNRLAAAEPLMQRALQIGEDSLGPHHPSVAIRLNNLAQLLKATNRLEKAEPLMRRALLISEDSLGPDHPNVAIALNNLALLLQSLNRLGEAQPLMQRATEICERSLGADHPTTQKLRKSLATLLQEIGSRTEQEPSK